MKILSNHSIYVSILICLFDWQLAMAEHPVQVQLPLAVKGTINLTLQSRDIEKSTDKSGGTATVSRNYRLNLVLPQGLSANVKEGTPVRVILPVVRNREAWAKVAKMDKNNIQLVLSNQVQQLEGQNLSVEIPIQPKDLYQIPFQAVYSPRGLTTDVFVVSNDGVASLVPIHVLQIFDDGTMIVLAKQLQNARVVINGNDNLISGEKVQILDANGVRRSEHD